MVDNIYVLEKALLRKSSTFGWVGPLVLTRHAIYFISLEKMDIRKQMSLAMVAGWKTYPTVYHAIEKSIEAADKELDKLENFTKDLDNLAYEKENSLKINKIEIISCRISKKYFPYGSIIIQAEGNQKHEIIFWEPKKITPEIVSFLESNNYPLKVGWGLRKKL